MFYMVFVTIRLCYKCFTSTETTRVSFVLGLWVRQEDPKNICLGVFLLAGGVLVPCVDRVRVRVNVRFSIRVRMSVGFRMSLSLSCLIS